MVNKALRPEMSFTFRTAADALGRPCLPITEDQLSWQDPLIMKETSVPTKPIVWRPLATTAGLAFLMALVAACQSAAEYYGPACEAEGVQAGTQEMTDCIERKELERRRYRQFINTGRGNN